MRRFLRVLAIGMFFSSALPASAQNRDLGDRISSLQTGADLGMKRRVISVGHARAVPR